MQTSDITCAAWEPDFRLCRTGATAYSFAAAARDLGVSIHEGVEATAIETMATGDRRVYPARSHRHRTVVAAPGAWGPRLLQPLGLDYGLITKRDQISIIAAPPRTTGLSPSISMESTTSAAP